MNNPRPHRIPSRGVSLIELLLYVSISATILLLASFSLMQSLQTRVKNETVAEVESQGRFVMNRITRAIRNGQSITSPTAGNSGASLTLNVVNASDDPTVFSLSAGTIQVTLGAGSPIPLINSRVVASDFHIENRSRAGTPGTVRISFTLSRVNNSGRNEFSYTRTFVGSATTRPN
jgi:Tfp pilus assembly protein PilW